MVALVTAFSSCNNDDDSPTVELSNANLAGTYEITFYQGDSETTVEASNGSKVVTEKESFKTDSYTNAIFNFNQNGTFTSSGSYRIEVTKTVTGAAPQTNSAVEILDESGTYSLNKANKTITINGNTYDVVLFDGDRLYITGTEEDVDGDFTTVSEWEIRLKRKS